MMRFSYLIPRIIILALIALAIWVGSDPLIRRYVVHKMENSIGAQVEIGELRASLTKQKLFIKELAITDPRDPMRNLFQADMAYMEPPPNKTWQPKPVQSVEKIGLSWLDQLPVTTRIDVIDSKSLLVETVNQYQQFWATELETQKENILALRSKMASLQATAKKSEFDNPLRKPKFDSSHVVAEVEVSSNAIKARVAELQQALIVNRQAIQQAYNQDIEALQRPKQASRFDADSITKLLLTKSEEENINEILGWFNWFRESVPDPKSDFLPTSKRGVDVALPIGSQKPDFLIKSLDLEGEGRFANQHNTFAGTVYNLTPQPELLDEPTSFELRAQGEFHVIVKCSLDRRKNRSIDTLNLVCPDLELAAKQLGEPNSMLVTMGPESRIQADINLQVIDDQLSGTMIFRHSNVTLHVDKLNNLVGGENTALKMNQGLPSVNKFVSKITLSGTFDDYQYHLQSDLGTQFAQAVDAVIQDSNQRGVVERRTKLDALLKQQLSELDEKIEPEIERLIQSVNSEAYNVADLRSLLPNQNGSASPLESRLPNLHYRR